MLCAAGHLWFALLTRLPGTVAEAQASENGIIDYRLDQNPRFNPPAHRDAHPQSLVDAMGSGELRARWRRIVYWVALHLKAPAANAVSTYGQIYLDWLDLIIGKLHNAGINVIVWPHATSSTRPRGSTLRAARRRSTCSV